MDAKTAPGSEPLKNTRHERFALAWAEGNSAAEAYRRAGFKDEPANAKRLTKNDHVKARRWWLQKQAKTITLLTIEEKREFLAKVVRTAISEIGPESPLCQKYVRTRQMAGRGEDAQEWETERIEIMDKLKAITLDNDLAGDGSEAGASNAMVTWAERLAKIRSHRKAPDESASGTIAPVCPFSP